MDKTKILSSLDILENLPMGVIVTNYNGIIEFINSRTEQITGYKKLELIGKTPSILKSGYHTVEFYKNLWNTIKSNKIFRAEINNKRKDGTLYWENIVIQPYIDIDNIKNSKFVAYFSDITDIRYKNLLFKAMIENSYDTHIIWDFDRRAIDVWPSSQSVTTDFFNKLKGHKLEEIKCSECIIPDEVFIQQNRLFNLIDNDPSKVYSDIYKIYKNNQENPEIIEVIMQRFNSNKYYQILRNITTFIHSKLALITLNKAVNDAQNLSYLIRTYAHNEKIKEFMNGNERI